MNVRRFVVCVSVALLFIAGCATAPEDDARRQAIEADIQDILTLSLGEDGKPPVANSGLTCCASAATISGTATYCGFVRPVPRASATRIASRSMTGSSGRGIRAGHGTGAPGAPA